MLVFAYLIATKLWDEDPNNQRKKKKIVQNVYFYIHLNFHLRLYIMIQMLRFLECVNNLIFCVSRRKFIVIPKHRIQSSFSKIIDGNVEETIVMVDRLALCPASFAFS